jgi:hypothetical protein
MIDFNAKIGKKTKSFISFSLERRDFKTIMPLAILIVINLVKFVII